MARTLAALPTLFIGLLKDCINNPCWSLTKNGSLARIARVENFVALDLELTPFSSDQQRIIEIAAIRFRGGEVAASYSTLVDPRCGLTPRIEALTGILQEQVSSAPRIDEVVPGLLAFIGSDPLVGQSINLDLDSLAAHGVRLSNRAFDTFELASLLLPGLPSYDLGTIARSLGVQLEQEHRALGDAMMAGRVFLALADRAARLDLEVLSRITVLAEQLPDWPFAQLFKQVQQLKLKQHFVSPGAERRHGEPGTQRSPLTTHCPPLPRTAQHPTPLDRDELRSLLRPGGPVASALPGFEEREEQLRMMDAVADALETGGHLLVEAGTGTGKSLSYLIPAIYCAVRNGRRVVVSTNTLNLQDQLYQKDIPLLQSCLPLEFKAALLKGRGNYLCLRRWLVLSRSANLSPSETLLLIKTVIWLSMTNSGDRAELNLSPTEASLWGRISAQAESCALSRCPQYRRGTCFVTRARRDAEKAHIVVVNHALLLTDVATSGGILPEYSHLIVDEAHHLETEATEQLGFTLSWADLHSSLAALNQIGAGGRAAGFLSDVANSLRAAQLAPEAVSGVQGLLSLAKEAVERAQGEGLLFFEALNCFVQDYVEERPRAGRRLRITSAVRAQPGWSEIEIRWSMLSERLLSLRGHLLRLEDSLRQLEGVQLLDQEGILAELAGFESYLYTAATQGEEAISCPSANGIYWVDGGASLEELAIRSAPLHVGKALNDLLFSRKDAVILTSATLTTEGSFDYVKERLGLEGASDLMLGSPFDYVHSTLLYVVQDIPEPTKPTCQRAVESAIADLTIALEGHTLVLFTSHAQLRLTSSAIRPRLEEKGILVLAHGLDGSRRKLLQAFKSSPKAVLMGTSSFWEGIDVVGDALSCLVIVKLPFSVPTDPVFEARSEAFDEPFRQFSVPQTILRLKQGFGRLIRSSTDRGVVVILDSRVGSKFYGPAFLHSLPRCTVQMGPASHVTERAKAWLSRR